MIASSGCPHSQQVRMERRRRVFSIGWIWGLFEIYKTCINSVRSNVPTTYGIKKTLQQSSYKHPSPKGAIFLVLIPAWDPGFTKIRLRMKFPSVLLFAVLGCLPAPPLPSSAKAPRPPIPSPWISPKMRPRPLSTSSTGWSAAGRARASAAPWKKTGTPPWRVPC